MGIQCIPVGPIQANCYLVTPESGPGGAVIDPGGESEKIIRRCEELGMTPEGILLTHGHFDHVLGVKGLLERWPGLPVYCHEREVGELPQFQWQATPETKFIREGDVLELGGMAFLVMHTPGHSPGSVTFRWENCLFTGDTLFAGSIGRTDLPGGDFGQILYSLKRLGGLEGDFWVYPGHDRASTLERERRANLYLQEALSQ